MIDPLSAIYIIAGLSVFEVVTSFDNAVVNADVLATMSSWARRWFLSWGILSSVFLVRAGLPLLIVYSIRPEIGIDGTLLAIFRDDPSLTQSIESSAPPLLATGGVFLAFLFLHWLFLEPKFYGLKGEEYFQSRGVWFYAIVSITLTLLVWYSLQAGDTAVAFGATIGSSLFFMTHGFRQNAEEREKQLLIDTKMSNWSKILYLEVIDASFSIDGVMGAFAFTFSIPLIMIGTGIGAFAVRQLTARNIENVKKYKYLKNGAMYSIAFLGTVMIARAFGLRIAEWISPLATIAILTYFFYRSWKVSEKK